MSTLDNWEQLVAGEKPKARFCVDCVNYALDDAELYASFGKCRRTNVNLVDGKEYPIDQYAADQRSREGPGFCGEAAKFWQAKVEMDADDPSFQDDDGA